MSYQEKRTIVSIIMGVLVLGAYCVYIYGKYQSGLIVATDMKFWAVTILLFIGVGIVAQIIVMIVFHILLSIAVAVKETVVNGHADDKVIEKTIANEMVSDEMDKLIELKSMRIGFGVAGIGFVLALIALIQNMSFAVMINIIFISFSLGSILEGFTTIYFYRNGVNNG
jgi:hypothetical protein